MRAAVRPHSEDMSDLTYSTDWRFRGVGPANLPLRVEGEDITLADEAGNRYDLAGRTDVALCRCG